MDNSRKIGQGKNGAQQEDLLPHWPAAERIKFEHHCPEIRLASRRRSQCTGETARGSELAIMRIKRDLHIVPWSECVGRVDMVVDMAVMLKMKLSSDDTSHHLLHTKGLPR